MSKLVVRYLQPIDTHKLVPVIGNYFKKKERSIPAAEDIENMIVEFLTNSNKGVFLVAVKDKEIIGFTTINYIWETLYMENIPVLNDLFIDKDYWNREAEEQLFHSALKVVTKDNHQLLRRIIDKEDGELEGIYSELGAEVLNREIYQLYIK